MEGMSTKERVAMGAVALVLFVAIIVVVRLTAPAKTMPVHIGEHEVGVVVVKEGCSHEPTRTLEPGWYEIDLDCYEVQRLDTREQAIRFGIPEEPEK